MYPGLGQVFGCDLATVVVTNAAVIAKIKCMAVSVRKEKNGGKQGVQVLRRRKQKEGVERYDARHPQQYSRSDSHIHHFLTIVKFQQLDRREDQVDRNPWLQRE